MCHKTVSATTGPVLYRLRTSAETVVMVVTLRAHGCPVQAIVAAFGFDERTGADWWARAGRQGQAVHEYLVEHPPDLGGYKPMRSRQAPRPQRVDGAGPHGQATLVAGWRGQRPTGPAPDPAADGALRRCAAHRPLLVCTDGLAVYIRAIRETCRDPVPTGTGGRPRLRPWHHVLIAQVVKRYERRRVVETDRRIVAGTPARVETLRCRSQGGGVIHTAYIERLNATFRERLAPLARRCRALARHTLTLHEGMFVVGTVSNFCTPHAGLSQAHTTTPAMAAGITDHCWTMHELLSFHVPLSRWSPPKPRGRPSHALKRLIAQWCGDHG